MENGNVMRHGELNKYHISFMVSDFLPRTLKMFATDKHYVVKTKENYSEPLTSLNIQCDTFFQHTLNFTFAYFNKKTDTTYF